MGHVTVYREQSLRPRAVIYNTSNNRTIKLQDIIYLINNGDFIHILTCCLLNVTLYVNIDNIVECVQCKVGVVVCI